METDGDDTENSFCYWLVGGGPSGSDALKSRRRFSPFLRPNLRAIVYVFAVFGVMMTKPLYAGLPFLLIAAGVVAPVAARADDASTVLSDCGAAGLPASQIDSCLERVRVLDETDPSPQLQSLEARLEQQESGRRMASRRPRQLVSPANSASSNMATESTRNPAVESSRLPPPSESNRDESPLNQSQPDISEAPAGEARQDRSQPDIAEVPAEESRPDESVGREVQRPADAGSDSPPAGINDDQPPVADPPDSDTPPDQSSDSSDDPR
jgi:hypothetical protein